MRRPPFLLRFSQLNIGAKVVIYYLAVFVMALVLTGALYRRVHNEILEARLQQVSSHSLVASRGAFSSFLEKVNSTSKFVMFDRQIRAILREPPGNIDLGLRRDVDAFLQRVLDPSQFLSSIYLFDNYGRIHFVEKYGMTMPAPPRLDAALWYKDLLELQGGFMLLNGGGGVFQWDQQNPVISFVRVINDVNTQEKIGVLVVNAMVSSLTGFVDTDAVLLDGLGSPVWEVGERRRAVIDRLPPGFGRDVDTTKLEGTDGERYVVTGTALSGTTWRLIVLRPYSGIAGESRMFGTAALLVMVVNSALLFAGGVLVSRRVTGPIKRLAEAMNEVGEGRFSPVNVGRFADEIGLLQDQFNSMVQEIESLLERTVQEQKAIRKAELDLLQSQIKPHFLYNSFDAVSSLAMTGRTQDVYQLIKALGRYYRTSLSRGSDFITVQQEVELVRDYVTIQRYRYGDQFTATYQMEPDVQSVMIPKLTLQPLVENALYHGIKPNGMQGTMSVIVRSRRQTDTTTLILVVEDNGSGTDRKIEPRSVDSRGFGLRATCERLELFYGTEIEMRFDSVSGKGTTVAIEIPIHAEFGTTTANISTT